MQNDIHARVASAEFARQAGREEGLCAPVAM